MATTIETILDQPSSTKRIWKIVIDNGITVRHTSQGPDDPKDENDADFQQMPKVSVIMVETVPMLSTVDSSPILNDYERPAYEDGKLVGSYTLSDPAQLTDFLALWEDIMTEAYAMVTADKDNIRWNTRK